PRHRRQSRLRARRQRTAPERRRCRAHEHPARQDGRRLVRRGRADDGDGHHALELAGRPRPRGGDARRRRHLLLVADGRRDLGRPTLVIVAGSVAAGLATLLLPVLPHPLLAFSLLGFLTGAAPGAVMALLPKTVAPERLATAFGVYYTVFYVVMALTQLAAGVVRDVVGSPAAPIVFAALVMAATVFGLALFRLAERAAPRPDASAPRAARCP